MDSGNSGSLQSSSGGDEEYDSRAAAESFSALICHPPGLSLQPPPPPFDPVSNYYFQIQNSNSNSPLFNPNVFLPRNMNPRSDQVAYSNHLSDDQNIINSPFMPSFQPATEVSDRVGPPPPPSSVADNNRTQNQNQAAARNPKKRSRASRRAPTTVLTTDTTNFRAMVQEFTGIPAPPFNSSTPFQRSRLDDLFSNTPFTSMIRSQPPLIHRPFSQKVQSPPPQPAPPPPLPPPFLASTNSTSSSTSNNAAASSSATPSTHRHRHLSNDQSSNLFDISNPILTSFLQNNNKFPFSNSINLGSKTQVPFQIPSNDHSNNKIGGLDEFSLGHGTVSPNLNTLPNLIPSDQIQPRRNNHSNDNNSSDDDLTRWRNNAANPDEFDRDQAQASLVHGNYNFSRNGKVNHLGSNSNFHGEKEQENVANRSEGMMESWICSSELK